MKSVRSFTTLEDYCEQIVDCPHSTPVWQDSGYLVIRNQNIRNGVLDLSSPSFTDEEHFAKRNRRAKPRSGDLIFTREAPMGEICMVPEGLECCLGQRQVLLRAKESNDSAYLLYAFQTPFVKKQIDAHRSTGSTVSNFCIPDLKKLLIPRIPNESTAAAVLSALDAKIELNQRLNAELEGLAKLLYDYWFVQYDFPLSPAQAAALRKPHLTGHPYRSSGGPMVFHPQLKREIPKGWEVGSLDQLGSIIGGSTPSTKESAYFTTEGIPWITPKDLSRNTGNKFITRGETDLTPEGVKAASLTLLPAGSVLMSSRAPIGYTAINRVPVATNQGFKSFVPDKGYPVEFIHLTLNHLMGVIEQNASGSTFKEVSATTLKTIKTELPAPETLTTYQSTVAPIFQQQDTLEQQSHHLAQLRDWLLPMLMNGQVTVR